MLVDFELDEGTFNLSPTLSGSTLGVDDATAVRTDAEAHLGTFSQELLIDGTGNDNWLVRHLSGGGAPNNNVALTSDGFLGFWLKTDAPGITVAPVVDDPGTGERGIQKLIRSDGQWHLYEWDLSNNSDWEAWVTGNGTIDEATVTLDSIQFFGTGDATIYLDTIAHNPLGSLLVPGLIGDYDGNGLVDTDDYEVWRSTFGSTSDLRADGNNDSVVDLADYTVWRNNLGQAAVFSTRASQVPEPSAIVIVAMAGITIAAIRSANRTLALGTS